MTKHSEDHIFDCLIFRGVSIYNILLLQIHIVRCENLSSSVLCCIFAFVALRFILQNSVNPISDLLGNDVMINDKIALLLPFEVVSRWRYSK